MAPPSASSHLCPTSVIPSPCLIDPSPYPSVGGNHEAANYLWELYYGGWAAPSIYFLGFSGCVKFGGLRIAGLSGIYKQVGV